MKKFKRNNTAPKTNVTTPTSSLTKPAFEVIATVTRNVSVQWAVNLVQFAMREERGVPLSGNSFTIVFPCVVEMASLLQAQRKSAAATPVNTPDEAQDLPVTEHLPSPIIEKEETHSANKYYPFEYISDMRKVVETFCVETRMPAPINHILWNLIRCILPDSTYMRILYCNIILLSNGIFEKKFLYNTALSSDVRRHRETFGRTRTYARNPFASDPLLRHCAAKKCNAAIESPTLPLPHSQPPKPSEEPLFANLDCTFVFNLWPLVAMIRRNYPIPEYFDDASFWVNVEHPTFQYFVVDFYYPLVRAKLKGFLTELDAQYEAHTSTLTPEQKEDFSFALPDLCASHVEMRGSLHPYHHLQTIVIPALHEYIGNTHLACVVLVLEILIRLCHSKHMQDYNVGAIFIHHIVGVFRMALNKSLLTYLAAHHRDIDAFSAKALQTFFSSPVIFPNDEGDGYRYSYESSSLSPLSEPEMQFVSGNERATITPTNEFADFFAQLPHVVAKQLGSLTPSASSCLDVVGYKYPHALRFFQVTWHHFVDVNQMLFGGEDKEQNPKSSQVSAIWILSNMATLALYAESNAFPSLPAVTNSLHELITASPYAAKVAFTRYFMLLLTNSLKNTDPFADMKMSLLHGIGFTSKLKRVLQWYSEKLMSGTKAFTMTPHAI